MQNDASITLGEEFHSNLSCGIWVKIKASFFFVRLQVNGKELSKSSHDETVEAFRAARDPVVVQVIRRTPSGRPHGPPQEIHVVDVCTQTDITFEHIMALAKLRPSTPPVPDVCPFLLSDRYVLSMDMWVLIFISQRLCKKNKKILPRIYSNIFLLN